MKMHATFVLTFMAILNGFSSEYDSDKQRMVNQKLLWPSIPEFLLSSIMDTRRYMEKRVEENLAIMMSSPRRFLDKSELSRLPRGLGGDHRNVSTKIEKSEELTDTDQDKEYFSRSALKIIKIIKNKSWSEITELLLDFSTLVYRLNERQSKTPLIKKIKSALVEMAEHFQDTLMFYKQLYIIEDILVGNRSCSLVEDAVRELDSIFNETADDFAEPISSLKGYPQSGVPPRLVVRALVDKVATKVSRHDKVQANNLFKILSEIIDQVHKFNDGGVWRCDMPELPSILKPGAHALPSKGRHRSRRDFFQNNTIKLFGILSNTSSSVFSDFANITLGLDNDNKLDVVGSKLRVLILYIVDNYMEDVNYLKEKINELRNKLLRNETSPELRKVFRLLDGVFSDQLSDAVDQLGNCSSPKESCYQPVGYLVEELVEPFASNDVKITDVLVAINEAIGTLTDYSDHNMQPMTDGYHSQSTEYLSSTIQVTNETTPLQGITGTSQSPGAEISGQ